MKIQIKKGEICMKTFKALSGILTALIVFVTGTSVCSSLKADAWGQLIAEYDVNTLDIFANRTKEEIAEKYSSALYASYNYDNYDYNTWYERLPSTQSPYDPGMISYSAHNAMISMTNFYRWMVGAEDVNGICYEDVTMPLQKGALVRNFCWQHVVSDSYKPEDMDDALWQEGADCNHNILAQDYTPVDAVAAWMSEGYNLDIETWRSVGHRAILMNYKLEGMSYGYCDRVAIGLGYTDNKTTDLPFTAYPSPGYMPTNIINPMNCSWSIKLNDDNFYFNDVEDLKVTITNTRTYQQWVRTYNDETLISSFGLIAFAQPDDFTMLKYSDSYRIVIEGIYDTHYNAPAKFTYRIDFFDMSGMVDTRITEVNTYRKYMISSQMMDWENLSRITAILPKTVEAKTDSGQVIKVPISGSWWIDMDKHCFVSSGTLNGLSSKISDPKGYLNRIEIPYEEKTGYCAEYDTLEIFPEQAEPGDKVKMSVYRTNISSDTLQIFQIRRNRNGSCSANEVYRSSSYDSADGKIVDETQMTALGTLSGDYISVYYTNEWLANNYTTPIYVCNSAAKLNVPTEKYDANGDGQISMLDAVSTFRMISGLKFCSNTADINNDGKINIVDLMMIKEHLQESVYK